MIAIGKYNVKATDAQLGTTDKGTDYIGIDFQILDEGEFFGHHITYYGYFSEKAFKWTLKAMRAAGFEGLDMNDLSSIIDSECNIEVEHDEWEGKVSAKVKWVNASGGVAMQNKMDDNQRSSFAKRMRAMIVAEEGGMQNAKKKVVKKKEEPDTSFDPDAFEGEEDFPEDFT